MKESQLTTKIRKALDEQGGSWFKVHGGQFQRAGLPDIIGCLDGQFVGLEVKRPGRPHPLTPLQEATLEWLHISGAVSAVVESVDEALELVRVLREEGVEAAREAGARTYP